MQKIGLFGGTFNPVHQGHVALAEHYTKALGLDKLLVIPTKKPPHKGAPDLAAGTVRLKLCHLAFSKMDKAVVTDIELQRKGKSFTIDTVRKLVGSEKKAEWYLIVGSDMFLTFSQWKQWQELLSLTTLCTAARSLGQLPELYDMRESLSKYGKRPMVFDFPVIDISSTEVRDRLAGKKDCFDCLEAQVYARILTTQLYTQSPPNNQTLIAAYKNLLQTMINPARYSHSLNVAEQAVNLAKHYGENEEKAYIAGLLHDVCKNMPAKQQLQWIKKSDIILDNSLQMQPLVWHGFAGAAYLQIAIGISDKNILNAVCFHTVARGGMSKLEQILYLADLTSKERDYPDVENMRAAAFDSLEIGMQEALVYSVKTLSEKRKPICQYTYQAYNQYIRFAVNPLSTHRLEA